MNQDSRIVDERGIASPAVRILMLELRRVEKLAPVPPDPSTPPGLLFSRKCRHTASPWSVHPSVYKLHERQVIFSADIRIVLTECRSDVNDSGTV